MEMDEMTPRHNRLLVMAGYIGIVLTIFQGVCSCSPSWSLYWGAPLDLVEKPLALLISGEITAIIFALFAVYAFSGAGVIRKLPFLRTALVVISAVFILRGLVAIPQTAILMGYLKTPQLLPLRMFCSSLVSLAIGLIYLFGLIRVWRRIGNA